MTMKTGLSTASGALNLLLIGALIHICSSADRPAATVPVPTPPPTRREAPAVDPESTPEVTALGLFRWSDLMKSNDYRGFVANLRAAGCPESTLEDIVRGDAGRVFRARRLELNLDQTQPGMWSDQSEQKLLERLLSRTPTTAPERPTVVASNYPTAAESTTLAAFLQTVDFTGGTGTEEQRQQMASLRQSLLEQISGANRVLKAEEAESMLGGLFGLGAAIQYDQYRMAHPTQN